MEIKITYEYLDLTRIEESNSTTASAEENNHHGHHRRGRKDPTLSRTMIFVYLDLLKKKNVSLANKHWMHKPHITSNNVSIFKGIEIL